MTDEGTETAFRINQRKHFQKSKHLLRSEVSWCDQTSRDLHLRRSTCTSHNSVTSHTQISDLFEGLILRSHPIGSKSKCNRVSQPPRRLWYSITLGLWPRCLRTSKFLSSAGRSPTKLHAPWMFSHSEALFKNDCTSTAYWYMLQHHEHKHENLELWRH